MQALPAGCAGGGVAAGAPGWRLTPVALDGSLALPRGDKRVTLLLSAAAPTVLGRSAATRVADPTISAAQASVELMGSGADVARVCTLKHAVFVLRSGAPPAALLSPGGRGAGAKQPRPVLAGEHAALRRGDTLLLARDPWRHAYRLDGPVSESQQEEERAADAQPPPPPPAPPAPRRAAAAVAGAVAAAPAETQMEEEAPHQKRKRKGAAPKRRPRCAHADA